MNKYEVLNIVGEGAYGVVLRCRNKKTNEIVAIKKFKDSEDDEATRKTILREVKMLRMLKQDNIVSLRDAFRRKKRLYLVFEYMHRNLLQVLEEKPTGLPVDLIRNYIFQLVKAILWCHQHNIIHRDIKPENLLVNKDPDTTLKLCDFGFARQMTAGPQPLTDYVATRWYRGPELLLGDASYGKPVDVWAIGCIMGELIDGQPLFPGESDVDQLFVIRRVLGELTPVQIEQFYRNPRFVGLKLPDMGRSETLKARYQGKMNKHGMHFLNGTLELDYNRRLTIEECYEHPFFDSCRQREMKLEALQRPMTCDSAYAGRKTPSHPHEYPPVGRESSMRERDADRAPTPKGVRRSRKVRRHHEQTNDVLASSSSRDQHHMNVDEVSHLKMRPITPPLHAGSHQRDYEKSDSMASSGRPKSRQERREQAKLERAKERELQDSMKQQDRDARNARRRNNAMQSRHGHQKQREVLPPSRPKTPQELSQEVAPTDDVNMMTDSQSHHGGHQRLSIVNEDKKVLQELKIQNRRHKKSQKAKSKHWRTSEHSSRPQSRVDAIEQGRHMPDIRHVHTSHGRHDHGSKTDEARHDWTQPNRGDWHKWKPKQNSKQSQASKSNRHRQSNTDAFDRGLKTPPPVVHGKSSHAVMSPQKLSFGQQSQLLPQLPSSQTIGIMASSKPQHQHQHQHQHRKNNMLPPTRYSVNMGRSRKNSNVPPMPTFGR